MASTPETGQIDTKGPALTRVITSQALSKRAPRVIDGPCFDGKVTLIKPPPVTPLKSISLSRVLFRYLAKTTPAFSAPCP